MQNVTLLETAQILPEALLHGMYIRGDNFKWFTLYIGPVLHENVTTYFIII
jgi:hypothetical protein